MPDLFSLSLVDYYERARAEVRQFVAMIPCKSIDSLGTVGYVASRTIDRLVLTMPRISPEPVEKRLEDEGEVALYVHTVENESSLAYSPSSKQFGGWSFSSTLSNGRFEIRINADGNPGPRERHGAIIQQLMTNIATLSREIEQGNAALLSVIEPEIEKRKLQCAEITKREAEL